VDEFKPCRRAVVGRALGRRRRAQEPRERGVQYDVIRDNLLHRSPPKRVEESYGRHVMTVKLSVGPTCHPNPPEIKGLFTQGWRPGRTVSEWAGGNFEMDSSDWSTGIRYQIRHCV
jgi:hypothetical protein